MQRCVCTLRSAHGQVLVVCVAPSNSDSFESVNSLQFGQQARPSLLRQDEAYVPDGLWRDGREEASGTRGCEEMAGEEMGAKRPQAEAAFKCLRASICNSRCVQACVQLSFDALSKVAHSNPPTSLAGRAYENL